MNTFIEGTMKRSVLILTCVILLLVWGGLSAFQMQRDYLPPINNTALMVTIQADQYQADQVKRNVTAKVEEAVHSVDNLDNMEMNSFDGGLMGSFYFPSHTNMRKAENEVKAAVDQIRFPAGVKKPLITRVSTNSFPVMRLSLTSGSTNIDESKLRSSIRKKVVTELKRVPGVRDVRVTGGGNNGYMLTLIPAALEKYGVTAKEIKEALSSIHPIWPQGSIKENNGTNRQVILPIRITDWTMNKRDLSNLKIPAKNGQTVALKEVAKIDKSMVDLQSVTRTKGEPSVLLDVLKTPSSNITDVTQSINERMEMIPEIKSKMVDLTVLLDQGKEIDSALQGLIKEGLLGIVFTVLCVFFFFRNIRSTMIIALSLPICLLTATTLLKVMGISLNLLTISGLIVAMGRVVDDSIVVIDNMYRKRMDKVGGPLRLTQLANGVVEMIPAIVSSTATTVAVFIPISILGGMISSAFSGFAWAVVIALITSLAVSILVVPALAHLLWSKQDMGKTPEIERPAHNILQWAFHKKKWVVSAAFVLLSITIAVAAFLPVNLFPRGNSKDVAIQIELPEDAQLTDVDAEVKNVESILKNNSNVETYSSTLGSNFTPMFDDVFDEGGGWMQKHNIANVTVGIKPETDPDAFIKQLRQQFTLLSTSAVYTVSNQAISGDDSRLKVILTGADHKDLNKAAILVRNKLQMIPGLSVEGTASDSDESMKYQLSLNQAKIEQLGINVDDVLKLIDLYLPQDDKVTLSAGDKKIPIEIHSSAEEIPIQKNDPDPQKTILSQIGHEMFTTKDGSKVSLAEITTLKMDTQSVISEKDGRPFTAVTGNIVTRDIGKVTKQVKETMNNLDLPEGMEYSVGGISKQMKQMIAEMGAALSLSVLLVLMIVSAVFRGWYAPAAVILCIPLALIGSVWSMVIFKLEWNLAALIGMLMLGGIVVTNGIVLVDKIERNLAEGLETKQAILQGTATRVRPVLMTAGATIFTLLPLAFSGGGNVIISKTLGAVVIGGVISSTLISLLVIPIMYQWLFSKAKKTKMDQRKKLPA
ncbi:Multidrug efflux pump subunit AcrB [Fictibacillus enclensis]|uniref:Acriflavine resistance protein B n=1 Tax=Fictibacillus enclensis TaxID=1017270 RepID=A0A0V8J2T6_9BACL|nr:efflux RND transporter permease subunit [Fictibacillus enclensis]KSU81144.1 acriflavine resistance protein B [Fictibacillus enclensis]SCC35496.1 Multidrug efflux pump subunit AcrB [Fictibacillus enclensis]